MIAQLITYPKKRLKHRPGFDRRKIARAGNFWTNDQLLQCV
jgi:hypothetical protein